MASPRKEEHMKKSITVETVIDPEDLYRNETSRQVHEALNRPSLCGGVRNAEVIAAQLIVEHMETEGYEFITDGRKDFVSTPLNHEVPCESIALEDRTFACIVDSEINIDITRKGDESIWRHINTLIRKKTRRVHIGKFAFREKRRTSKYVYVSRFDGNNYRLDGQGIELVKNGTDDVVIGMPGKACWAPYSVEGDLCQVDTGLWEQLFSIPKFPKLSSMGLTADEQRRLLEEWLFSLFFINQSTEKPILLAQGPAGSGKTLLLEMLLRLLFGENAGIPQVPSDIRSFIAGVEAEFIYVLDNLEDFPFRGLRDLLCRVTGSQRFGERKLYTDSQVHTVKADCFLAITCIHPRFARGDVASRLLWLELDSIENHQRRSREEIEEFVDTNRDRLLAILLCKVNERLKRWKEKAKRSSLGAKSGLRVRAFSDAILLMCKDEDEGFFESLFEKIGQGQATEGVMYSQLYNPLRVWIANRGHYDKTEGLAEHYRRRRDPSAGTDSRKIASGELYDELRQIALAQRLDFYNTPISFGKHLKNHLRALQDLFSITDLGIKGGNKHYYEFHFRNGADC